MARQVNFFALLGDGEGDDDVSALLERVAALKAEPPPAEKKKKKEKQQQQQQQQEQHVKKEESDWGLDDADLTKAKPLVLPDYGDCFQTMGSFSFLFLYSLGSCYLAVICVWLVVNW